MRQASQQLAVLVRGEPVSDAFGLEGVERAQNGLRPAGFAGVRSEPQAVVAGARVELAKQLGSGASFVAADTSADDIAVAQLYRFIEYFSGGLDPEVTRGVENPQQ